MKISIEVDLEPSEFDLASELLRTLNLLTEHVKIKQRSSTTGSAAGPRTLNVPVPSAVPIAAPTPVQPVPIPLATPVPIAQTTAPVQTGFTTALDARAHFNQLIASLADTKNLEPVSAQVERIFATSSIPQAQLQDEFQEALFNVAFDQRLTAASQSVAPYMYLLPRLPPAVRDGVKNSIMKKVLTHLNQKRPVDSPREEFLLQAEAFAVLCELDFVGIDGAVLTLERLLKSSDRRAAAITTLAKTVERCKEKVANATPTMVASLFSMLDGVMEEQFRYDIQWINNYMGRQRPQLSAVQPPPTAVAPPAIPTAATSAVPIPVATPTVAPTSAVAPPMPIYDRSKVKLHVKTTFKTTASGPSGTFFALGWDPKGQQLISGGKEVPLTVWSQDGMVKKAIDCAGLYICCVDVELSSQLLLTCGIFDQPQDEQDLLQFNDFKSCIAIYDGRPGQDFRLIGEIKRPEVNMIAVVKALPGTSNIITSESISLPNQAYDEHISLYDLNTVINTPGTNGAVQPITRFTDHNQLVTCLAPLPTSPGAFVSGARDRTVKVWDARTSPSALFTLVTQGDQSTSTHQDMITCVDAAGELIVSGSLEQGIAAWDIRAPARPLAQAWQASVCNQHGQQVQQNDKAILKVALERSPIDKLVAVATVGGLYTVDFAAAEPVINAASAIGADGVTPKQYSDVKWNNITGQLYASASNGASIDLLEIYQA